MNINWLLKTFNEVTVKSINSPKLAKNKFLDTGSYPVIDQSQEDISGYTNDEKLVYSGKLPVVIFGDHTLIVKYIDFPFVRGADGTKIITANSEIVIPKFLYYLLLNSRIESHGYSRHFRFVKELSFKIPPLKLQKKIVERLDAIRKLQELNDKEIEKVKLLFSTRLSSEFSKKKGWKEVILSDICDVRDGTHDSPKYHNEGIPLITSKNLKDDDLDFANVNFISEKDHKQIIKRSFVENGDILFGMIGTIGNPVVVDTDEIFSIKNVGLVKFPNKALVNNYYLKYFLESPFLTNQITRLSRGGTQKFVSLGNLRNLKIFLPKLLEQDKIACHFNEIRTYQYLLKNRGNKLTEFFESTLNKAMRGELVS